jgi:hypothetical protein
MTMIEIPDAYRIDALTAPDRRKACTDAGVPAS